LDIPSDGDFVAMSSHVQSIIIFLGHDLKNLFTFERRQAMICKVCQRVTHSELADNHDADEGLVYDMGCPSTRKKRQSLSECVSYNLSNFDTACDTRCPFCHNDTMQTSIIHSSSQYFLVHPFRGQTIRGKTVATTPSSFVFDKNLFLPIYPAQSEGVLNVEYKLKAFVKFFGDHFTTYFTIKDNDAFWIFLDDNRLPTLRRRKLDEPFPVELAIYEKVVAREHVEPRQLLPREELIRTITLDEIATRKQELEELHLRMKQAGNLKSTLNQVLESIREVDDYMVLVESHGNLASIVLETMNPDRLRDLNMIDFTGDEPDSFIDAYRPVRVILEKTVHDLNTPVKEARLSDVTNVPLSDVYRSDLTAMNLANDLPVGINEHIEVGFTEANPVSSAETAQVLAIDLPAVKTKTNGDPWMASEEFSPSTQETVLEAALCNRISLLSSEFIDCSDAPVPTSIEENTKSWYFPVRDSGKFQVFSIDNYYKCSLPSFIWRSLNALFTRVYPSEKRVIGTAPRNICEINGLRDSTIQVDLITRQDWWRFGKHVEVVRFALAFTFKKGEKSFDIAVWENYNEPGEWEIGFLHTSSRFFDEANKVMRDVDKKHEHPFYHLLRRAVQVMTGKQAI
jgi:hypothetical protein